MIQEYKELFLIDLSARLPHGVYVYANGMGCYKLSSIELYKGNVIVEINEERLSYHSYEIKPYLRPMSSMTEEEKKEFNSLINGVEERCINAYGKGGYTLAFTEVNDWLNAHHFDYRGLIEKGLALQAPEGMY